MALLWWFRKRGGVQNSMGNKVPWKIGTLIYLPVTSRPLFSCRKKQFYHLVTSRPAIWRLSFWIFISLELRDPWNGGPFRNAPMMFSGFPKSFGSSGPSGPKCPGSVPQSVSGALWAPGSGVFKNWPESAPAVSRSPGAEAPRRHPAARRGRETSTSRAKTPERRKQRDGRVQRAYRQRA